MLNTSLHQSFDCG